MAMTRKKRRIWLLATGGVMMAAAAALVSVAFQDSIAFFVPPTELAADPRGPDQRLRVGGMVIEGSMRKEGTVNIFRVTDFETELEIRFDGVLPDLIKAGQGAVADGHVVNGVFVADEVLAKHDEKYVPAELEDMMSDRMGKAGDT